MSALLGSDLKKCDGCDRLTTADYCCAMCGRAAAQGYEIHEDGPLGHSDTCDERNRQRQAVKR